VSRLPKESRFRAVDVESETPVSNRDRWISFWAAVLAAWGFSAAATVANAMLPQIQGDLSASLDQVSWIITASIVASALGIPPTPWLAARFGFRRVLLCALVLFTVSSCMIAISSSLGEVVFWRIGQALFGAPIMVLSQSFTVSSFEGKQRGMAMAIWSVALTTGWVFGPAMGAYLADWHSWRLSFFMVCPISLISIVVCWFFIPRDKPNRDLPFDWFGFGALSIGLIALQTVINRGQREDWFDSQEILILSFISFAALTIYAINTCFSAKRFVRWQIFRDRNLAVGVLLTSIFGFISLAPLVLVPPMLGQIKGLEVVTIGLVITPRGIVQIVLMLMLGPYVARLNPRVLMAIGFISYAAGSSMMASYNMNIGLWDVLIPQLLQGVTSALVWLPLFHILYTTLQREFHNEASMINGLVYNLISSAGVAALVVILSRSTQINTAELAAHITSSSELLRFPEFGGFDPHNAVDAAAMHAQISQQALMIGYVNIFWLLTWIALAALPLLLLIPTESHNRKTRALAAELEATEVSSTPAQPRS